ERKTDMVKSKSKGTKSSRFGPPVKKSSLDQSLHNRLRPQLEQLEVRIVPSLTDLAPPSYAAPAKVLGPDLPSQWPQHGEGVQAVIVGGHQGGAGALGVSGQAAGGSGSFITPYLMHGGIAEMTPITVQQAVHNAPSNVVSSTQGGLNGRAQLPV